MRFTTTMHGAQGRLESFDGKDTAPTSQFVPGTGPIDVAMGGPSVSAASKRWSVACAASLMNLLQTGAFFFTPTTLMPLLVADFGLDLAVSTLPIAVGKIAYVLLLVPGGMLVDIFGPRRCVIAGIAGLALFLTLYALLVSSLAHVITAHVCLAMVSSVSGVPVYSLFIAQWFEARVGLAMGFVLAGYSAAGTAIPTTLGPIATEFGWRAAMAMMASLLWIVGLPVATAFLKEKPEFDNEDEGLVQEHVPENLPLLPPAQSGNTASSITAHDNKISLLETLEHRPVDNKSWTFVGFSLNYMLLQYSFGCFGENILFFLTLDRGYSLSLASLLFSCLNLASFCAKLVGGHLGDRFDRFHVGSATSALAGVGTIFLFIGGGLSDDNIPILTRSPIALVIFSILFGFGYGATFNCLYVLVPLVFGKKNLGRIQSTLFGLGLVGNAAGSIMTGVLRSRFGSYDRPFLVAGASCLVNFLVFNVTRLSLGWSITGLKHLSAETEPVIAQDALAEMQGEDAAMQRAISSTDVVSMRNYSCSNLGKSYESGFFGAVFKSSPSVEQFLYESGSPRPNCHAIPVPDSDGVLDLGSSLLALSPDISVHSHGGTPSADAHMQGVEFESGFPFARDWSSQSLVRLSQGRRRRRGQDTEEEHLAESPSSRRMFRTSSTLENLIDSGILSSSLEDIGYVGNMPSRAMRSPSVERMQQYPSPPGADNRAATLSSAGCSQGFMQTHRYSRSRSDSLSQILGLRESPPARSSSPSHIDGEYSN